MEELKSFLDSCEAAGDEEDQNKLTWKFCSGGGCKLINSLLNEETKRKGAELAVLFSCLHQLFSRIGALSESDHLQAEVTGIAQNLVRNNLRLAYTILSPSNSASQVKSGLRALTAAVGLSSSIAREIATNFNFDDPVIHYNLDRRSKTDTPDCRTRYIQFLISFFLDEDTAVVRALLDRKNVIQNVLPGLVYDDAETVQLFLLALIEKVVQSSAVSKTQKVKVFNFGALDSLLKLYRWEGPEKFEGKKDKSKKKEKKIAEEVEPSEQWKESRAMIADTVHELLVNLCSSHKQGIAFCDFSIGTSGRNLNPLCWHLVQKVVRPWEDAKMAELISKTLCACPDLLRFYFEELGPIAAPRPGQKWKVFAEYIEKIIESQNMNIALGAHEHYGPKQLVTRATYLFLPPSTLSNHLLRDSLTSEDVGVQTCGVKMVVTVLKKSVEFRDALLGDKGKAYSEQEKTNTIKFLKEALSKGLPFVDRYIDCVKKHVELLKKKDSQITLDDIQIFSYLLQVFRYADICLNTANVDLDTFYLALLSDVIEIGNSEYLAEPDVKEFWTEVQLEAINLVAGLKSVSAASLVASKDIGRHVLQTVISLYNGTKDLQVKQRIFSIYANFMSADGFVTPVELAIWLSAGTADSNAEDVLVEASLAFLEDSPKYANQLRKAVRGNNAEDSGGVENPLIEAMMEEDFDPSSFTAHTKTSDSNSLSPFIFAVIESSKGRLSEEFWDPVVRDLLSIETNSEAFHSVFSASLEDLCSKEVRKYISAWTSGNIDGYGAKVEKKKVVKGTSKFQDLISLLAVDSEILSIVKERLKSRSEETREFQLLILSQALLYLRHSNKLRDEQAAALLEIVADIIEISKASGNAYILPEFLANNCVFMHFNPFSTDQFRCSFMNLILGALNSSGNTLAKSRYEAKIFDLLEDFLQNQKSVPKGIDLELIKDTLEVVKLGSRQCAKLLTFVAENVFAKKKKQVVYTVAAVLLKRYALNRLTCAEQGLLDVDVFVRLCKMYCAGGEGVDDLAEGLKVFLVIYPTMVTYAIADGEGSPDIFAASVGFGKKWSAKKEELACFLLKLSPYVLKNKLEHIILTNETLEAAETREEAIESVQIERLCPRLIAQYLKLKEEHSEDLDPSVVAKLWDLYHDVLVSSIVDPNVFQNCMVETKNDFLKIFQSLAASQKGKETLRKPLTTLLEGSRTNAPLSHQILPLISLSSTHVIVQSVFQSVPSLCKQTLNSKALTEYLIGYSDLILKLPSVNLSTLLSEKTSMSFIKSCLKFGLRLQEASSEEESQEVELAKEAGRQLIELLNVVVEKMFGDGESELLELIYTMTTSHSDFMPLMINDRDLQRKQKGSLLKLLLTLTKKNSKLCKTVHIPVYLSAYRATLDPLDQSIFELLSHYESQGAYLQHYRPLLWGDPAFSHSQGSKNAKLLSEGSMQEVISLLDTQVLKRTSESFPVSLRLEAYVHEDLDDSLYDPRFLLQSFFHLLSSDQVVPCQAFIQNGCLSLALASLTSRDDDMRALGYAVLCRFYYHLEGARFYERPLWTNLLDSLRHSLSVIGSHRDASNLRLTSLIGVFLAQAANIMSDPQHEMYKIVHNFLLVKPSLDVQQVPEFYVLFNSSEHDHRQRRKWILQLLRDGFREHNDYLIAAKRKIFRILTTFYDSPLSDEQSKVDVLEILLAASKVPSVAFDLVRNRSILSWIESLLLHPGKLTFARTQLQHLTAITVQLWKSCEKAEAKLTRNAPADDISVSDSESEEEGREPAAKRRKLSGKLDKTEIDATQLTGLLCSQFFKLVSSLWAKSISEVDFTELEAGTIIDLVEEVVKKCSSLPSSESLPPVVYETFTRKLISECARFIVYTGDLEDHCKATDQRSVFSTFDGVEVEGFLDRKGSSWKIRSSLHRILQLTSCK